MKLVHYLSRISLVFVGLIFSYGVQAGDLLSQYNVLNSTHDREMVKNSLANKNQAVNSAKEKRGEAIAFIKHGQLDVLKDVLENLVPSLILSSRRPVCSGSNAEDKSDAHLVSKAKFVSKENLVEILNNYFIKDDTTNAPVKIPTTIVTSILENLVDDVNNIVSSISVVRRPVSGILGGLTHIAPDITDGTTGITPALSLPSLGQFLPVEDTVNLIFQKINQNPLDTLVPEVSLFPVIQQLIEGGLIPLRALPSLNN